jgi:hypothetical protein
MAVLVYRDELSAWVRSFNVYRGGEGADKEFYLSIWAGGIVKATRKSEEASIRQLEGPFLGVLGATTPDMLSVLDERQGREDGFFQRLLCSFPKPKPAFRLPRSLPGTDGGLQLACPRGLWDVVVRRLFCWREPVVIWPTPAGYQVLVAYLDEVASMLDRGADGDVMAMLGKHRAYVLRLSLIVHALRAALGHSPTAALGTKGIRPLAKMGEIEEEDARAGVALSRYFQGHYMAARRVMQSGPEERRIADFVAWALGQGGRVEPADVYKAKRFGCKGKADAVKLFRAAQDRGRGAVVQEDEGGRQVFFARA